MLRKPPVPQKLGKVATPIAAPASSPAPAAVAAIPMTGTAHVIAKPTRPDWIKWRRNTDGRVTCLRIPGILKGPAPAGFVPEGSPEEIEMRKGLEQ